MHITFPATPTSCSPTIVLVPPRPSRVRASAPPARKVATRTAEPRTSQAVVSAVGSAAILAAMFGVVAWTAMEVSSQWQVPHLTWREWLFAATAM